MVNSSQGGGTKDTWVLDRSVARHAARAPPTISTGSRATSSAPNISRASSRRRSASPRCRSPMSARPTNGSRAVATAGCADAFFAHYDEANERDRHRLPRLLDRDNPSSIRNCFEVARTNARAVRTALTDGDVGGDQRHLARAASASATSRPRARSSRASCDWVQESSLRFDGSAYRTMLRNDAYWFSRLGVYIERADNTARILDVKYHLLLPARRARRRPARLFPVVGDPALGLGAHRLSLGLSREPEAVAGRRPADPQRADAALARELLREPGAEPRPHRRRLRPAGPGAAPGAQRSARGCRTAAWTRSSSPACTSSSARSSPTTTGSAARSREQYLA